MFPGASGGLLARRMMWQTVAAWKAVLLLVKSPLYLDCVLADDICYIGH